MVKEALHIQKTPANNRLNRDGEYELPGSWIVTIKKLGGGVSSSRASANHMSALTSAPDPDRMHVQLRSHTYKLPSFSHLASFLPWGSLDLEHRSSQYVGKLYMYIKY